MTKLKLSYSVLNAYKKCPRSFMYRYLNEAVPLPLYTPVAVASPLEFGHLVHRFMELWLTGDRDVNDVKKQIVEESKETSVYACEGKRGLRHLMSVIDNFIEYVDGDPFKLWKKPLALEPELNWHFATIDGVEVTWSSHFDGIVEMHNGDLMVLEHKTTSSVIETDFEKRTRPNAQVNSYIYALKNHGDPKFRDVKGVLFNALSSYYVKTKARTKRTYVAQLPIIVEDWEIQEWYEETYKKIEELIRDIRLNQFNKNAPDACTVFGRPCTYRELCMLKPEDRQKEFEDYYVQEPWKGFSLE